MLEIDIKPYKVTVQFKNRRGFWTDMFTCQANKPFTDEEIYGLVKAPTCYNTYPIDKGVPKIRVVSSKGNQLVCSKSVDFMVELDQANLVSGLYECSSNPLIYNLNGHTSFMSYKSLCYQFENRLGIRKAVKRKPDPRDRFLNIWDVYFNDKTKATYVLYK